MIPILYYDFNTLTPEQMGSIFNAVSEIYPDVIILPRQTELVFYTKEEVLELIEYELKVLELLKKEESK